MSGFAWFLGYTCHQRTAVGQRLRNFWNWYTTGCNPQLNELLNDLTFGRLPSNWNGAVRSLLVGTPGTRIADATEGGAGDPNCTGKPGA